MYLLVNAAQEHTIYVALGNQGGFMVEKQVEAKFAQEEKLLVTIDAVFAEANKKLQDLAGIIAVTGPGSFSALRISIATVNAMACALDIPVVGYTLDQFSQDQDFFTKAIATLEKTNGFKQLKPFYNKEPNIG